MTPIEHLIDNNRITTYSLLAHINNNNLGLKDLSDVFLPLVKSTIAKLSCKGINKGKSLQEIKDEFDKVYALDIPYPLLRKIVAKIAEEENKDGVVQFQFHKDDSFIIKDYTFTDYEETLQKQDSEVEALNAAYNNFISLKGLEPNDQISLFDFLDQNRANISVYFTNNSIGLSQLDFNQDLSLQAEFIVSLKSVPALDKTLKKVYLGSIISGYLEVNVGDVKHDVEFVLDTNFVTGLMNLSSESSHHTCKKILEICRRLKYRVTVLDITLREAINLIEGIAETLDASFIQRRLDPESIANACDRRSLTKTDLQIIALNLQNSLADLGIEIIHNTSKYEGEARNSNEFTYFSQFRHSNFSALHDATGVIYVKKKRGKPVTDFYKANCWFVTNTPHQISHLHSKGFVPEIIRAEDLINILWLSSPEIPNMEMLEVGLTRLISSAYSDSLPSARVLKELDNNIKKYAKDKISPHEVFRVANAIASKTVKNLDQLNQLAKKSEEEFIAQLKDIAVEQAIAEQEREKKRIEFLNNNQRKFDQRLSDREADLREKHKKDLEEVSSNLSTYHGQELIDIKREELTAKIEDLKIVERKLRDTLNGLESSAETKTKYTFLLIILMCVSGLTLLTFNLLNLEKESLERLSTILQIISPFAVILITLGTFLLFKESITLSTMHNKIYFYFRKRTLLGFHFDEKFYNELKCKISATETELQNLK